MNKLKLPISVMSFLMINMLFMKIYEVIINITTDYSISTFNFIICVIITVMLHLISGYALLTKIHDYAK